MTAKDLLLAKVLQFIRYDWPNHVTDTDHIPTLLKDGNLLNWMTALFGVVKC